MLFRLIWLRCRRGFVVPAWLFCVGGLMAAESGPTLHFDYGAGEPRENPLPEFMYFVPLVSPEQVMVQTNLGDAQRTRVTSFQCRTNGGTFRATCEFALEGTGVQCDTFDHALVIQRRRKDLEAGKTVPHRITTITVKGEGDGSMEIDGTLSNGVPAVTEIRMRFNARGRLSPVTAELDDISLKNGVIAYSHPMVARINVLRFQGKFPPKMEVVLASVKKADAGNGVWSNFIGELKGAAANAFMPPLDITTNGLETMMAFGQALAEKQASFTFPAAGAMTAGPALAQ